MSKITRRSFLQRVGSGLIAFVPAASILADVTEGHASGGAQLADSAPEKPDEPPQVVIFENYAEGVIRELDGRHVIVETRRLGDVTLRLTPETKVWKGDYNGTFPMAVGDHVDAWGQPHRGGKVIDVEKMWLNIVNLRGPIVNVEPVEGGLQLSHIDTRIGEHLIKLDGRTAVMLPEGEEKNFDPHIMHLTKGQGIQVIGLRLDDDTVLATRIWAGNVLRKE